ncbi:hypothetical protein NOR53_2979 [gamma proteobacterium NOR5-3]|nr:hypothetical protein NOR53_2979 [gamma proteobacterium NOR5-3]
MTEQIAPTLQLIVDHKLQIIDVLNNNYDVVGLSGETLRANPGALQSALHPADGEPLLRFIKQTSPVSERMYQNIRVRDETGRYRVIVATLNSNNTSDAVKHPACLRLQLQDPREMLPTLQDDILAMIGIIMESTDDYIYFKDTHHILLAGSQSMAGLCAGIDHWSEFTSKSDYEVFPEDLADDYYSLESTVYDSLLMAKEVQAYRHRDGKQGWVDNRKYPILDERGALIGLYGVARDISTEIQYLQRQSLSASVFEHAAESIVILDAAQTIIDVNRSFETSTALKKSDVQGQSLQAVKHRLDSSAQFEALWNTVLQSGSYEGEVESIHADGTKHVELCRINAVLNEQEQAHHFVCLYSDITRLKHHEQELESIANFDTLTGLVNRQLFEDRLEQSLANCERRGNHLALAYIDIDSFKHINDSYGHTAGDDYLIGIANNMQLALRDTDTLARIGGDEFIALITDLERLDDLEPVTQRLLEAATLPVMVNDRQLTGSASIGIARYPLDGEDAGRLIRCADQAMYEAKQQGKRRLHVFDRGLLRVSASRDNVEAALDSGEFELLYQPKINLISGELVGFEALARWNHPQRGLLQPAEFLPLIDRENLQLEFGDWVLDQAVKQIESGLQSNISLPISVNIAGVHLRQTDFVESIASKMQAVGSMGPQLLEIEILETSALDDLSAVAGIISSANALGISFSLDDFGTGFSSLTHLRRLPVSTVKIDTSFVRDMLESEEDFAIVSSIVSLCRGLNRRVVAEGVSSVAHAKALIGINCIYGQGFGIARPMRRQELSHWINDWQATNIWLQLMAAANSDPADAPGESNFGQLGAN